MDIEAKLSDAVDYIGTNDATKFRETVADILLQKANDRIDVEKQSIAATLFSPQETEVTPEETNDEQF
jgi:hypothetical protein